MPIIRIELSSGRTRQQKSHVAKAVTAAMEAHCGCSAESVRVLFFDVEDDDWAIGGILLSESCQSSAPDFMPARA